MSSETLSSSLAPEVELLKQKCRRLREQHGKFCIEYDSIEPQLLRVHSRMTKGRELKDDCDIPELLNALQTLYGKARDFIDDESTDKKNFHSKIKEVIEIIRQLKSNFNTIISKIDSYQDEGEEGKKNNCGIGEQLVSNVKKLQEMGELMQLFNVIWCDHLQEEMLADRIKRAQSS